MLAMLQGQQKATHTVHTEFELNSFKICFILLLVGIVLKYSKAEIGG
jgi:uncharacterized membrane protein